MRFSPLLLLLTAAAPPHYIGMNYAPPIPPATPTITRDQPPPPPGTFQPAPMPNRDLAAPTSVAANEPSIAPTVFNTAPNFSGDGFGNSSEQAAHDHRLSPSAGLNLSMPVSGW